MVFEVNAFILDSRSIKNKRQTERTIYTVTDTSKCLHVCTISVEITALHVFTRADYDVYSRSIRPRIDEQFSKIQSH